MIVFPTTVQQALASTGTVRAGGTELQERRRLPNQAGDLIDLRDTEGLEELGFGSAGELRIGARVRIADVADHPAIRDGYPGFSEAAGGLATPQIRAVATVGGNLLQHNRCWYYRAPEAGARCFKRGGSACAARDGDHLYSACFDVGPCVSVHPSTLGMAMLAYDGRVEVEPGGERSVAALLGDGSDPRHDHQLETGSVLRTLILPLPAPEERSAYFRAISRARSEWPLVEVLARVTLQAGVVSEVAIAIGGVAPAPRRAPAAEAALRGRKPTPEVLAAAARAASDGASPLPMTAYKVELVEGAVLETLERALAREPRPARPGAVSLPNTDAPSSEPETTP